MADTNGAARKKEITLPATAESTQPIVDFVEGYLSEIDAPFKVIAQINVVIDEIYSNIAKFAYKPDAVGDVTVSLDINDENDFSITFVDHGEPFNPLEKEDPDVDLGIDERGIGGLGIFIVKKTMDDVQYKYENNSNILILIKKII